MYLGDFPEAQRWIEDGMQLMKKSQEPQSQRYAAYWLAELEGRRDQIENPNIA